MILIVITGTCGAGKSTIQAALEERLDARRFACVGADETGLNWHDYAGTDREQSYNGDCLRVAAGRAAGRHLVFASCMTPQDYMTQFSATDAVEATYFVALSAEDDVIEGRLRDRPPERGFTTEEAIRPHIEYNRWIRKNRSKYQLHIDTTGLSVSETADQVAAAILKWTEG